ncbi:MAG: DNA-3-methyladenine glycosylase I [Alphaproteobacteria bacterium]|nr:DNA-3-methyladenine glycosylase I [Alphaproteobacteria bacterium]
MSGYCKIAPGHEFHGPYHDTEYGFPSQDERVLHERLALEIMQAGLSWLIVLKKRRGMNAAFHDFDVDRVAAYGARDIARLLKDENIIRNRLKVESIIDNARRIQALRESHGGFAAWLDVHHPQGKDAWVKLFKKTFRFTGGEVVGEFLMSLGYLPGAHHDACPVYRRIERLGPPWARSKKAKSRINRSRESAKG